MFILILLLQVVVFTGSQTHHVEYLEFSRGLFNQGSERAAPFRTTPKHVNTSCVCGQINSARQDDIKIINGAVVKPPHKYPWMVLLKRNGMFICGGSIINDKFVLTAAHCVTERNTEIYEIVVGVHNISKLGTTSPSVLTNTRYGQRSGISHIKVPIQYGVQTVHSYDIALLKLITPIKFTKQVSPICLPTYEALYSQPARDSIIMGWGITETFLPSNVLREAVVQAINAADCRSQSFYLPEDITEEMICAVEPGKDTCQGDSGGPLVIKTATSYTQLGIVSWGTGCALSGYPGVYTSVPTFVNYIYSLTRGGNYCRNPDAGV